MFGFSNRALAHERQKDYASAAIDYTQATRLEPKNAGYWNLACWARAISDQLEQALKDCNESLRLRPNDSNTIDSRGLVYLKLGQIDKAIADYEAVMKLDPKAASSLYALGMAKNKKEAGSGDADLAAAKVLNAKIDETFAGYGVK